MNDDQQISAVNQNFPDFSWRNNWPEAVTLAVSAGWFTYALVVAEPKGSGFWELSPFLMVGLAVLAGVLMPLLMWNAKRFREFLSHHFGMDTEKFEARSSPLHPGQAKSNTLSIMKGGMLAALLVGWCYSLVLLNPSLVLEISPLIPGLVAIIMSFVNGYSTSHFHAQINREHWRELSQEEKHFIIKSSKLVGFGSYSIGCLFVMMMIFNSLFLVATVAFVFLIWVTAEVYWLTRMFMRHQFKQGPSGENDGGYHQPQE